MTRIEIEVERRDDLFQKYGIEALGIYARLEDMLWREDELPYNPDSLACVMGVKPGLIKAIVETEKAFDLVGGLLKSRQAKDEEWYEAAIERAKNKYDTWELREKINSSALDDNAKKRLINRVTSRWREIDPQYLKRCDH